MGEHPIQNVIQAGAAVGEGIMTGLPGAVAGYVASEKPAGWIEKKFAPDLPGAGEMADPASPDNPDVQDKMRNAAAGQRKARGRASTILTGGLGASGQITTARRTLLGS